MIFLVFFKDWFTVVHGSAVSFICPAVPLVSGTGLLLLTNVDALNSI